MNYLFATLTAAAVYAWALAHQLAIAWVVAVLIERLPPPDESSSKVYAYIYGVLQFMMANSRRLQDAVAVARKPVAEKGN